MRAYVRCSIEYHSVALIQIVATHCRNHKTTVTLSDAPSEGYNGSFHSSVV